MVKNPFVLELQCAYCQSSGSSPTMPRKRDRPERAVFLATTDSSFQKSSLISMLIRNGELTRKLYDQMRNKIWNRSLCHYKFLSFSLHHARFPLLHFWCILRTLFRKFHEGAIPDRRFAKRPIMPSLAKSPIEHTVSQLYRPESGLYIIESISFITVSEKGPAPTLALFERDPSFWNMPVVTRSDLIATVEGTIDQARPRVYMYAFCENQNDRESLDIPRSEYSE